MVIIDFIFDFPIHSTPFVFDSVRLAFHHSVVCTDFNLTRSRLLFSTEKIVFVFNKMHFRDIQLNMLFWRLEAICFILHRQSFIALSFFGWPLSFSVYFTDTAIFSGFVNAYIFLWSLTTSSTLSMVDFSVSVWIWFSIFRYLDCVRNEWQSENQDAECL